MRPKAIWELEIHKVFVDLCVEQIVLGRKPGTHFTKEGWRSLLVSFQEKTGAGYDRMQLKNHWDTMGRQWKTWRRLTQCSYMKWYPETNTFGANDEDWVKYLQANPEAGQYRLNPPPFLEKLEIIFAGHSIDTRDESPATHKRLRFVNAGDATGGEDEKTMTPSSSGLQGKGYWSQSSHEVFVDLCMQETLKGNRPDTHLNKEAWKTILKTINEKTGISYTRAQLKNHWDCTRTSWKIWCQLVGAPSMKWDPETRTFGATEEEWKNYIRESPRAGQFRHKQIPHADKLAIIFHGVINPRDLSGRPPRKRPHHHSSLSDLPEPTPLSVLHADEAGTPSPDEEATCVTFRRRLDNTFADSQMHEDEQTPEGRATTHRNDVVESRSNLTAHESPVSVRMALGNLSYSIGECIDCLDSMEEVEQGSDLYMFALDMFLKQEYREIFLQLKKPSLRLAWLLRLHSVGPSLI